MVDEGRRAARTVLVVEDEVPLSVLISEALDILGWETKVATSAETVREAIAQCPLDIVLADIQLADGSNGFDAIAQVFDHNPDARAIIMSGGAIDPIREESRQRFGHELPVLSKPFTMRELRTAIE